MPAAPVLLAPVEGMLQQWEAYWLLHGLYRDAKLKAGRAAARRAGVAPNVFSNEGAVRHWRDYRNYLLRLGVEKDTLDRVWTDFSPPDDMDSNPENSDTGWHQFGPLMAEWSLHSRRVYNISPDLYGTLNATDLTGVKWRDVMYPFDAFILRMPQPLEHWETGSTHRLVLITRRKIPGTFGLVGGESVYSFMTIPEENAKYRPVSDNDLQFIRRKLRSDAPTDTAAAIQRITGNMARALGGEYLAMTVTTMFATVDETAEVAYDMMSMLGRVHHGNRDQWIRFWNPVLRVTCGLGMYLRSLTPKQRQRAERDVAPNLVRDTTPDARCITDVARVCEVASVYDMSPETVVLLTGTRAAREALYQLGWRLIQGHWRRPKGLGWNPLARRTIHVRPYAMRKDRRPEAGLSPGAEQGI